MDKGESKNIVIPTAIELITKHLQKKSVVKILDVGCFNGAMLNQIRINTPDELRQQVHYAGAEVDKSLIDDGRKKYPELTFNYMDLNGSLPDLGQHDIVVLSNVLHEVTPNSEGTDAEAAISATLREISSFVTAGGNLLILDGLKPNHDDKIIEVHFTGSGPHKLYKFFAQKYSAFKVHAVDIGTNAIQTRGKDLVTFMTKARYLFEDYWPIESQQSYQFFTKEQFYKVLGLSGFRITRFEPQRFTQEYLNSIYASTNPKIEYPAKNVLVVATKIN
ncbi:MAG: hypothetical protein ABIJ85_00265 [bacterium]